MAPEYEKAAKELSQRSPPIPLAKVDGTVENEIAGRFEVTGYPTIKIFRKGKVFDYNGPREQHGRWTLTQVVVFHGYCKAYRHTGLVHIIFCSRITGDPLSL